MSCTHSRESHTVKFKLTVFAFAEFGQVRKRCTVSVFELVADRVLPEAKVQCYLYYFNLSVNMKIVEMKTLFMFNI